MNKKIIVTIGVVFFLALVYTGYFIIERTEIGKTRVGDSNYYKGFRSVYYREVPTGCLDICVELIVSVRKIKGSDAASFENVPYANYAYSADLSPYFIDKGAVYFGDRKVNGADPNTFSNVESEKPNPYFKDGDAIYYEGKEIDGADPKTFVHIKGVYFKDKSNIYDQLGKIQGADPTTFMLIGDEWMQSYAKDSRSVYINREKIQGADPGTFVVMKGSWYSKDRSNAYYEGRKIQGADSSTFVLIQKITQDKELAAYAKDSTNVYANGEKVQGADPGTFREVGSGYFRDQNSLYLGGKKIRNVD